MQIARQSGWQLIGFAKMYERSPQESPTVDASKLVCSAENSNLLVRAPKSVCRVLTWTGGNSGKHSDSRIIAQAIVSGLGGFERSILTRPMKRVSSDCRPVLISPGPGNRGRLC